MYTISIKQPTTDGTAIRFKQIATVDFPVIVDYDQNDTGRYVKQVALNYARDKKLDSAEILVGYKSSSQQFHALVSVVALPPAAPEYSAEVL